MARTVLQGGNVFDGTGAAAFRGDVAIEDGRIVEVGGDLTGDEVIDVSGKLVIPGLIDAHSHALVGGVDPIALQEQPFSLQFFEAAENLKKILHSGITTTRDAGGIDLGVKRAVELGMIPGPRLKISISVLSQTGGHGDGWTLHGDEQRMMVPHPGRPSSVVDGTDEMRKKVRELFRAGADTIKLCTSGGVLSPGDDPRHSHFNLDEIRVAVEEAAAAGADVMSHAQGSEGIKNALRAGVRSIEHGIYLDDEGIELFHETGAWLVPTLLAPAALNEAIDAGARMSSDVIKKAREVYVIHEEAIRRAHAAGVKIAMGTDAGVFPHGSSWRELGLLVGIGMTPEEALVAATKHSAELLRIEDEVGTLEAGKAADIVVLGGDDVWNLDRFGDNTELVIQAGNVVVDKR